MNVSNIRLWNVSMLGVTAKEAMRRRSDVVRGRRVCIALIEVDIARRRTNGSLPAYVLQARCT